MAAVAALPVAGLPCVPHRLAHLAPAEPGVKRGVDRDVEVGGDGALADEADGLLVVGRQHEDPGHDLLALADVWHHGLDVVR